MLVTVRLHLIKVRAIKSASVRRWLNALFGVVIDAVYRAVDPRSLFPVTAS
jgi:hypothetical protein